MKLMQPFRNQKCDAVNIGDTEVDMIIPMCMSCSPGDTNWFGENNSVLIKCTENVFDERLHEHFLFIFVSNILLPSFMHDTHVSS